MLRIGQTEYMILVPAQIKAHNYRFILKKPVQLDIAGSVYHLVIYMQSNNIHKVF